MSGEFVGIGNRFYRAAGFLGTTLAYRCAAIKLSGPVCGEAEAFNSSSSWGGDGVVSGRRRK